MLKQGLIFIMNNVLMNSVDNIFNFQIHSSPFLDESKKLVLPNQFLLLFNPATLIAGFFCLKFGIICGIGRNNQQWLRR